MERLLKWSIQAQSDPENAGPPPEDILAQLFGGANPRSEMTRHLQVAVESDTLSSRKEALDELHYILEDLNNANELGTLWEPLLFVSADAEPEVRCRALSAIAAAVQNNEKAQGDLVATRSGVPHLYKLASTDKDSQSRSKAWLALACAVGHCPAAYDQLLAAGPAASIAMSLRNELADLHSQAATKSLSFCHALILLQGKRQVLRDFENTDIVEALVEAYKSASENQREKLNHIFDVLDKNALKYQRP